MLLVFSFYDFVGVACQFAEQAVGCCMGVDAYPMFGRHIEGFADAWVVLVELRNAFRLTLERDEPEVVAVEKGKNMSVNIEDEHSLCRGESSKGQFLIDIVSQGEAVLAVVLYVHRHHILHLISQRIRRPTSHIMTCVQFLQCLHIVVGQGKVKQVDILLHTLPLRCLRNRDDVVLYEPF